jgi:HK97 gp10 family phage protein
MIGIELAGQSDVFRALQDLSGRRAGAIQRKALTAGDRVVARKAKDGAPRLSGTLGKAIGQKVKIYRSSGIGVGIVGPRTKFKKAIGATRRGTPIFRWPSKTAGLVERGTKRSRPQPFMEPAAQSSASEVLTAMEEKAREELAK